jgi:hypothetical protein
MPSFVGRATSISIVTGCLAWGCIDPTQAAAPPPASSAAAQPPEQNVVVLPNNTTVHAGRNRVVALREGEIAWELRVPDDDTIIAPLAVGLNSTTYVRGAKGIHAASPDGKWLWSKPLEGRSFARTRNTDGPVTLGDSTVALVVGDEVVRFEHDGTIRWRLNLPEGHVSSRLAAGMDGSLIASTTAGVYSIAPDGRIGWRRVLEP